MADTKIIKRIDVGGESYDIYDEYARRRLEGLTNVYTISCLYAYKSGDTFVDYETGADIAYSTMTLYNSSFKSSAEAITVSNPAAGTSGYIVLLSTVSANKYYAMKIADMQIGDTVYVKEYTAEGVEGQIADRWLSSYQESPLSGTFTALDEKVDLKEYAKKTEAGKAGSYTTGDGGAGSTGAAGAATITTSEHDYGTATGSATFTYNQVENKTGSAHGGTAAATGGAGGHTVDFSKATFTGTSGTVSVEADAATIDDHTINVSGSLTGSQTVDAHSHAVNLASTTVTYATGSVTSVSEAGEHSHSVSSESATLTYVSGVDASTGEVAAHSHTVTLATTSVNSMTGVGSLASFTQIATPTGSTRGYMFSPTVADGLLKWSEYSFDAGSLPTSATVTVATGSVSSVSSEGKHSHTIGHSTATVAYISSVGADTGAAGKHTHTVALGTDTMNVVSGATVSTAGAHTISGSNFSFAQTITATHSFTDSDKASMSGTFTPTGSISGSQTVADHTHSYTAPADHTHSIAVTVVTATASVEVAIGKHSHTVTVADHTHSIGNHSHSVTIDAIETK